MTPQPNNVISVIYRRAVPLLYNAIYDIRSGYVPNRYLIRLERRVVKSRTFIIRVVRIQLAEGTLIAINVIQSVRNVYATRRRRGTWKTKRAKKSNTHIYCVGTDIGIIAVCTRDEISERFDTWTRYRRRKPDDLFARPSTYFPSAVVTIDFPRVSIGNRVGNIRAKIYNRLRTNVAGESELSGINRRRNVRLGHCSSYAFRVVDAWAEHYDNRCPRVVRKTQDGLEINCQRYFQEFSRTGHAKHARNYENFLFPILYRKTAFPIPLSEIITRRRKAHTLCRVLMSFRGELGRRRTFLVLTRFIFLRLQSPSSRAF